MKMFDLDEEQVKIIEEAMAEISNNSCITFWESKEDEHAVIIQVLLTFKPVKMSAMMRNWAAAFTETKYQPLPTRRVGPSSARFRLVPKFSYNIIQY